MVENAEPHFIIGGSINQIPEWPDQVWIDENAPTAGIGFVAEPQ